MADNVKISLKTTGFAIAKESFSVRVKEQLNPERNIYQITSDMLVISNIDGDFSLLENILLKYNVINDKYGWIFKDKHLVILGNCIGNDIPNPYTLWLIYSLERKAIKRGGYIHFLLGEQEIKHLNGMWRFQQPSYARRRQSNGRSYAVLYDGNQELWRWLRTKNTIEKIGTFLFTQGGINVTKNHNTSVYSKECNAFKEKLIDDLLSDYSADKIITGISLAETLTAYNGLKGINIHSTLDLLSPMGLYVSGKLIDQENGSNGKPMLL